MCVVFVGYAVNAHKQIKYDTSRSIKYGRTVPVHVLFGMCYLGGQRISWEW